MNQLLESGTRWVAVNSILNALRFQVLSDALRSLVSLLALRTSKQLMVILPRHARLDGSTNLLNQALLIFCIFLGRILQSLEFMPKAV